MKKSLKELAEILSEDEVELLKAWREDKGEPVETEEVSANSIVEAVTKSLSSHIETLTKAVNAKDDLIKALSEKVETMAKQPAYDKRSISTLEAVEKGTETGSPTIQKAQVLDAMLDLQKAGKGVTSHHIAEFESTGNISNQHVKNTVFQALKQR